MSRIQFKKKLTFHFHAEDYNPNTQQKAQLSFTGHETLLELTKFKITTKNYNSHKYINLIR